MNAAKLSVVMRPRGIGRDRPATGEKNGPRPYQVKPDLENVHYGPHERNVLDFWKAKSGSSDAADPQIFTAAGFVQGDKTSGAIQNAEVRSRATEFRSLGMNYRYSHAGPVSRADGRWRAAPCITCGSRQRSGILTRISRSHGGSAGAGILMWVDSVRTWPIRRARSYKTQSSKLHVLGPVDGQEHVRSAGRLPSWGGRGAASRSGRSGRLVGLNRPAAR